MTPDEIDCRRHAHFSPDRPKGYRGRHGNYNTRFWQLWLKVWQSR